VRKWLPALLIMLSAFFLVLAVLTRFYAGNSLLRVPLDVDTTTHLIGTATVGSDPEGPVKATSISRADSKKSSSSVIVWDTSSCLVKDVDDPPNCVDSDDPQNRLIDASTDKFATDRNTALAVQDRKYVSADAGEHKGLINKFPFETEKKTYPYWDGTVGRTLDAVYKGTSTMGGVKVYKFTTEASDEPIEIADGVDGLYSSTNDIYVEPLTGAIINQVTEQSRATTDGTPVLSLKIGFTDGQIDQFEKDAKQNRMLLNLVRVVVPIVSLVLGLLMLVAGLLLWRRDQSDVRRGTRIAT
jgi:hypothetical protein